MCFDKYKIILLILIVASCSAYAKVKLPAILSDGMVLQRESPLKIWGKANAGEKVVVTFKKRNYPVEAGSDGKWSVLLPAMKAGGPYEMQVNDITLKNILIGDVWLCSGQSNMELTVNRVTDMFREEIESYENNMIHYVKTPYGNSLHGPEEDVSAMEWKPLTVTNAPGLSALAYFFAKEMYETTKVPVGIVNSSWGGSAIEAWMSEDALQDFPRILHERDVFHSDEYKTLINKSHNIMSNIWNATLYRGDKGLCTSIPWFRAELDDSHWETQDVFSSNWAVADGHSANGSHWFRQNLHLTAGQADKDAVLRLGCMVDADSVFVNGVFVGATSYQYPPRVYKVPATVLKSGDNNITVRLISYGGRPSFVQEKLYCMVMGGDTVQLSSRWKYKRGCEMPSKPGGISFQNVPTGMYNSMISPLKNFSFKGALWYQGETNTGRSAEYEALLTSMIHDWRQKLCAPNLPFVVVQLPNFMQSHTWPVESGWAQLREAQRQVSLKVSNVDLAVAIDLGEWNDIHPLNKKELARRIALLVKKSIYGYQDIIYSGPLCTSMVVDSNKVILSFEDGTDDLFPVDKLKGFAITNGDGRFVWAEATIDDNKVIVWNDKIPHPVTVRYAWDDNPREANLKNKAGLPAIPFEMSVDGR